MRIGSRRVAALLVATAGVTGLARAAGAPAAADLILTDARIYTAAAPEFASALAVRAGRLAYVGDAAGAKAFAGNRTIVRSLHGAFVLPGLVDAHVHPLDIVDLDVCSLDSRPLSLAQISTAVAGCLARYRPAPGHWLKVHDWNFTAGNQPDARRPSLRAALDAVSTTQPIELLGNDAHHGAFNSAALALAHTADGRTVGLSRATLAHEFAQYAKLVGVDERGEPNGAVNEDARYTMDPNAMLYVELDRVAERPERVVARLNSVGITAFIDAMAAPSGLPVYERLRAGGHMTARANLAQFYDPARMRRADGSVDWDGMVASAERVRARFAGDPYLRADTVKLFADGVLEGNPLAVPPTLPNAASLHPYLQPRFTTDAGGEVGVSGYVDPGSAECAEARADAAALATPEGAAGFRRRHGFHPAQCVVSDGQLQHPRDVIMEFARRFHRAGFSLHIHAIGDRAVRTAVDAIEAARAEDGNSATRDGLAHVQLVDPADVARIGRDRLYVAATFAWANAEPDYDVTVVPFLEHVSGGGAAAFHPPGGRYDRDAYPFASLKRAGAVLVAGSDAPVETRDPRPFVNVAAAVARRVAGHAGVLNAAEAIGIGDALRAYTIDGARALGREAEVGSLEPGKSADFVIVDRDPVALAAAGRTDEIAATRVVETWFEGRRVYRADVAGRRPAKR